MEVPLIFGIRHHSLQNKRQLLEPKHLALCKFLLER